MIHRMSTILNLQASKFFEGMFCFFVAIGDVGDDTVGVSCVAAAAAAAAGDVVVVAPDIVVFLNYF